MKLSRHLKTLHNNHITECKNKTYGPGCLKTCGHCVNGEQCNHVNGTCHNGCEAGIYGSHCQMGISLALK